VFNAALSQRELVACLQCDLLQELPELEVGGSARCPRCDHELWRRRDHPIHRTLPLALAAAILFVIANAVPMLGLSVAGRESFTTVIGGAAHLWNNDQQAVAVLVLLTAVLAPGLQIGITLAVALAALRDPVPSWAGTLLRRQPTARTWSMIEVMLLGVLVALIKIADYASVVPGTALFVLGTLVFLLAAMQAGFDPRAVWERVEWADGSARAAEPSPCDEVPA